METTWSHGHYPNALYTYGFYREMAPNWLDFAALIKGHRPLRREGEPFRYLELGSGMGLHLCLLAAAYPEGTFVGVDFHADQIAHSRQLADQLGLTNITFVHGDLVALADGSAAGRPTLDRSATFHYVATHGLFSWVSHAVQEALLNLAADSLAIGGLFFCSYNTLPGWNTASIFQHLAEYERRRSDPLDPLTPYRRAGETLQALTDPSAELPTPLARAFPALEATVRETLVQDPHYLLHEYANTAWQPLYVDDVHPRMADRQLRFLGSATLPELFAQLLPPVIQQAALAGRPLGPDQLLLDIATNKRFRRDLFVHGYQPLNAADLAERMGAWQVVSTNLRPLGNARYPTSFGDIQPDPATLKAVMAPLTDGPASLGTIAASAGLDLFDAATLVALMLQGDQVGLQRTAVPIGPVAVQINHTLIDLITAGAPYGHLVAPMIGSAVATPLLEAVLLKTQGLGLDSNGQAQHLLATLDSLGQKLLPNTAQGHPVDSASPDPHSLAQAAVQSFVAEGIEKYRRRGSIPAQQV